MKKLGYIVSPIKLRGVADFIEVTNDVKAYESDKPTLIVGVENARKIIKNFSIIKKTPEIDKFWTFGKTERRDEFDKDLKDFYRYVLDKNVDSIRYFYVNFFKLTRKQIINLFRILYSLEEKIGYIYKDMLYLYYSGYVLGISLRILKYCGVNPEKYLEILKKNKNTKIFYNDIKINDDIKHYIKNKRYLMPYFYSLLD